MQHEPSLYTEQASPLCCAARRTTRSKAPLPAPPLPTWRTAAIRERSKSRRLSRHPPLDAAPRRPSALSGPPRRRLLHPRRRGAAARCYSRSGSSCSHLCWLTHARRPLCARRFAQAAPLRPAERPALRRRGRAGARGDHPPPRRARAGAGPLPASARAAAALGGYGYNVFAPELREPLGLRLRPADPALAWNAAFSAP